MNSVSIAQSLARTVGKMTFEDPVAYTYNPIQYARRPFHEYLKRYGSSKKEILLVGMNPGPFGMAQTGVPFGDVAMVRDWLDICEKIEHPSEQHPKRPIHGFDCTRSEVSGTRLWGWAKERYRTPQKFFKRFFIWNYCPLCFMEAGGKNLTPDKLQKEQSEPLFAVCNEALVKLCNVLEPKHVIGVGKFAEKQIIQALSTATLKNSETRTGSILHPSPASPLANRGWAQEAEKGFEKLGIRV